MSLSLKVSRHVQKKANLMAFQRFKIKAMPPQNARLIFSESRGGSTLLMEWLQPKGVITQWEPLHPNKGLIGKYLRMGDRPFLPANTQEPKLVQQFEKVFSGYLCNEWTTTYNTPRNILLGTNILVKMVRANMLLPWMMEHLKFINRPVFLMRHPLAVAHSQVTSFAYTDAKPAVYKAPICLNNERFLEHEVYLNQLPTPVLRQVALWCINNMTTIKNKKVMSEVKVVTYEDLVLNPMEVLSQIEQLWGEGTVNKKRLPEKVSQSSYHTRPKAQRSEQVGKWRSAYSQSELKQAQEILDYFGCDFYHTTEDFSLNSLVRL